MDLFEAAESGAFSLEEREEVDFVTVERGREEREGRAEDEEMAGFEFEFFEVEERGER